MLRARRGPAATDRSTRNLGRACVLGDIDLVRALALGGIRSVVAARPGDPLGFSRYTDASLALASEWTERELVVQELMRFGLSQPSPPVLFYQGTASLLTVSRNRERLSQAFRFQLADAELVERLTDKASFQTLAEIEYGLRRRDWSPRRILRAREHVSRAEVVWPGPLLLAAYVDLRIACDRTGHALRQQSHDAGRWIAASAIHLDVPLVSHDGVFRGAPGLAFETALTR